jgi:hypothetical protein
MTDDPGTPPPNTIFSREELSPDGTWRVVYDYMDGERSPLIVSPRIIEVRTQRIVLDLWKTIFNGYVSKFTPTSFHLAIRDPYGPKEVSVDVDVAAGTCVIDGDISTLVPLGELEPTLQRIIQHARDNYHAHVEPVPLDRSFRARLRRWMYS